VSDIARRMPPRAGWRVRKERGTMSSHGLVIVRIEVVAAMAARGFVAMVKR
jgi:hypothetical protein